ncbi:MAG: hypothetical protein Q4C95_05010 [Planctomycetia bacterium]|nr:hypothetical protein [Planctomycetia bacterium]
MRVVFCGVADGGQRKGSGAGGFKRGKAVPLGSPRDLFIDDHLIASMENVELWGHHPERKELTFIFDQPREGNGQNSSPFFWTTKNTECIIMRGDSFRPAR